MNSDINSMFQMMGGNPKAFLETQLQQNPALKQAQVQLTNMANSSGMSQREFVMQYAKQKGIPLDRIQALANRLGIK